MKWTSATYPRGFVEWLEYKYVLFLRKLQLSYGQVVGNIRDIHLSSVKLEFAEIWMLLLDYFSFHMLMNRVHIKQYNDFDDAIWNKNNDIDHMKQL